ncbi:hypothetical protein HDU76_011080, partial [Blyttiomyces sp. JEL0837]
MTVTPTQPTLLFSGRRKHRSTTPSAPEDGGQQQQQDPSTTPTTTTMVEGVHENVASASAYLASLLTPPTSDVERPWSPPQQLIASPSTSKLKLPLSPPASPQSSKKSIPDVKASKVSATPPSGPLTALQRIQYGIYETKDRVIQVVVSTKMFLIVAVPVAINLLMAAAPISLIIYAYIITSTKTKLSKTITWANTQLPKSTASQIEDIVTSSLKDHSWKYPLLSFGLILASLVAATGLMGSVKLPKSLTFLQPSTFLKRIITIFILLTATTAILNVNDLTESVKSIAIRTLKNPVWVLWDGVVVEKSAISSENVVNNVKQQQHG